MKLLILSDIHSNVECAKAILGKEQHVDRVYFAGDVTDYGTDPVAAIRWLREHEARCVLGNHDQNLLRVWHSGEYRDIPAGKMRWVHHNCKRMGQAEIDFLESLPTHLSFEEDGVSYLMAHRIGTSYETVEGLYHFERYWEKYHTGKSQEKRRMIFGHTHRQSMQIFSENALWLNPGSASYRREDDPSKDAFYAVIENGAISLRHTPYDRDSIQKEVQLVKNELHPDEYRVADYFFIKTEEDGPGFCWLDTLAK